LPVADILNRFVAAFFVFILGMTSYLFVYGAARRTR